MTPAEWTSQMRHALRVVLPAEEVWSSVAFEQGQPLTIPALRPPPAEATPQARMLGRLLVTTPRPVLLHAGVESEAAVLTLLSAASDADAATLSWGLGLGRAIRTLDVATVGPGASAMGAVVHDLKSVSQQASSGHGPYSIPRLRPPDVAAPQPRACSDQLGQRPSRLVPALSACAVVILVAGGLGWWLGTVAGSRTEDPGELPVEVASTVASVPDEPPESDLAAEGAANPSSPKDDSESQPVDTPEPVERDDEHASDVDVGPVASGGEKEARPPSAGGDRPPSLEDEAASPADEDSPEEPATDTDPAGKVVSDGVMSDPETRPHRQAEAIQALYSHLMDRLVPRELENPPKADRLRASESIKLVLEGFVGTEGPDLSAAVSGHVPEVVEELWSIHDAGRVLNEMKLLLRENRTDPFDTWATEDAACKWVSASSSAPDYRDRLKARLESLRAVRRVLHNTDTILAGLQGDRWLKRPFELKRRLSTLPELLAMVHASGDEQLQVVRGHCKDAEGELSEPNLTDSRRAQLKWELERLEGERDALDGMLEEVGMRIGTWQPWNEEGPTSMWNFAQECASLDDAIAALSRTPPCAEAE